MGSSASKAVRKYPKTSQIPTGTRLKDQASSIQHEQNPAEKNRDEENTGDVSGEPFSTGFLERLQKLGQVEIPNHQQQQQFLVKPKPTSYKNTRGTSESGITTHHALLARQQLNRQLKMATVDFIAQDESTPRKQLNAATLSEILYLRDKGMSTTDLNNRFNLDPEIIPKLSNIKLPVGINDGTDNSKDGNADRRPMTVTEAFAEQEAEFVKKIEKEKHDKQNS